MLKRLISDPKAELNCRAPVSWPLLKGRHIPRTLGHEECPAAWDAWSSHNYSHIPFGFDFQGYPLKRTPLPGTLSYQSSFPSVWGMGQRVEMRRPWRGNHRQVDFTGPDSFILSSPALSFIVTPERGPVETKERQGRKSSVGSVPPQFPLSAVASLLQHHHHPSLS